MGQPMNMQIAILLVFLLGACSAPPEVSDQDLLGRYVYVAHDAGTPHPPETLTITATEACITKPGNGERTSCGQWSIIRGYGDSVVIPPRGFTIDRRRGRIVLVEDDDLDWMYEKVD